jgi:phage shock protein PspC (stress-responsive transcriptional regulator)
LSLYNNKTKDGHNGILKKFNDDDKGIRVLYFLLVLLKKPLLYTQSNVLYIELILVMPNEERQNVLPEATAEGFQ